ncbi:MAG: GatB/YqeY domain-containing protein, partial [Patescibacteria group bacterium]
MIHTQIKEQMKDALRKREALRLSVLRGLLSAFTNEAVAKGKKPDVELTDEEVITVIKRQSKQRKDSILQFRKGNRE